MADALAGRLTASGSPSAQDRILADERRGCARVGRRKKIDPRDLVGLWEAAAIVGWTSKRLASYITMGRGGVPRPIAHLKCGPIWTRDQIIAWGRERGYLTDHSDADPPAKGEGE